MGNKRSKTRKINALKEPNVHRGLEHHETMRHIVFVDRLAIPTEILRAVHATVPFTNDGLHVTVAECGFVAQVAEVGC